MCQGRDISVRQHSKSEHWAPFHIQTSSQYYWKIIESDVIYPDPNITNQPNKVVYTSYRSMELGSHNVELLAQCIGTTLIFLIKLKLENILLLLHMYKDIRYVYFYKNPDQVIWLAGN